MLFVSTGGQSSRKLAKLAGLADATEARTLIRQLNSQLDADGRAYRIEEVAGGYVMMTRPRFAPWLRRLAHIPTEARLGQSAMETLAIVAYRQPVMRANIEAIRGVGCSEVLKQLMDSDLVRICGRSEDLGRPYLYGTTSRFLQMFGLRSADRLPRIDWVNEAQFSLSSSPELVDSDSAAKESAVNMRFSAAATLGVSTEQADETLLDTDQLVAAIEEDDDDVEFDDEDDVDEEDDDDWEDDEDDLDVDEDEGGVLDEPGDETDEVDDEEEVDDEDDAEEDAGWEEVDDDDDDDWDDEEDEDDDWDEDDDDDDWD
ncbi:MAG: SMC-Scp complex subunit ScpB [Planctomycetales bacterium]|nr:SMC-Scp complex subunit ScpB [Planctomycetales bacterium]